MTRIRLGIGMAVLLLSGFARAGYNASDLQSVDDEVQKELVDVADKLAKGHDKLQDPAYTGHYHKDGLELLKVQERTLTVEAKNAKGSAAAVKERTELLKKLHDLRAQALSEFFPFVTASIIKARGAGNRFWANQLIGDLAEEADPSDPRLAQVQAKTGCTIDPQSHQGSCPK